MPSCGEPNQCARISHPRTDFEVSAWQRAVLYPIPEVLDDARPILVVTMCEAMGVACFRHRVDVRAMVHMGLVHQALQLLYQVGSPDGIHIHTSAFSNTLELGHVLRKPLGVRLLHRHKRLAASAACKRQHAPDLLAGEPSLESGSGQPTQLQPSIMQRSRGDPIQRLRRSDIGQGHPSAGEERGCPTQCPHHRRSGKDKLAGEASRHGFG
mmetsp:Transcript_8929/g.23002  ORF Transcript_8929/g.23002 Transcript_8929/m.23002 type:complete len:211 (-) Transcript_8929:15-647(-)